MTTGRLMAGVAETEITPPVGAVLARELESRRSTGRRTPLMASALVLSEGACTLALVTLDLVGLRREDADHITAQVAHAAGLDPAAVLLVCSHTQGGPATVPLVGSAEVDEPYVADLAMQLAAVVTAAQAGRQEAALGVGHASLPHLMYNHRLMTRNMKVISAWLGVPRDEVLAPEGPIDPTFSVLVLRDGRGFPLCLLWNVAADNRFPSDDHISADLPALVQEQVDTRLERHVPVLHVTGCGGNVSYSHDLERTADAVASAVMAVQLETPCDPCVRLRCAREVMVLPMRDSALFGSKADIALKLPRALAAFTHEVELLRSESALAVPASVQVLRLGRYGLAGLPGMPFVELALAIKERSPFGETLVVGNVHDYPGYVIPRPAFAHEGFEAWPARTNRLGPGAGEFMVERAVTLLHRLR